MRYGCNLKATAAAHNKPEEDARHFNMWSSLHPDLLYHGCKATFITANRDAFFRHHVRATIREPRLMPVAPIGARRVRLIFV